MISAYATLLLLLGAAITFLHLLQTGITDKKMYRPSVQPIAQETLRQNS